jgi:hypothetical protein
VLEPNTPAPQSTPEREQTAAYIAWKVVIIVIAILMGIFGLCGFLQALDVCDPAVFGGKLVGT